MNILEKIVDWIGGDGNHIYCGHGCPYQDGTANEFSDYSCCRPKNVKCPGPMLMAAREAKREAENKQALFKAFLRTSKDIDEAILKYAICTGETPEELRPIVEKKGVEA